MRAGARRCRRVIRILNGAPETKMSFRLADRACPEPEARFSAREKSTCLDRLAAAYVGQQASQFTADNVVALAHVGLQP